MADNVIARKNAQWSVFSTLPDVCKTPMGGSTPPVPYPVVAQLQKSVAPIGTVTANADRVVAFDQTNVPTTEGDAAGTAKGVKSGTVGQQTWPLEKSSTVKAEDKLVVRHDDKAEMNGPYPSKAYEKRVNRRKCRQELVAAGKASGDPATQAAAARFETNILGMDRALLSEDAYEHDPNRVNVLGYRNISNDDEALARLGLRRDQLSLDGTNYGAQVYEPNRALLGPDARTVVAFRGTDVGAAAGGDAGADAAQAYNLDSGYYRQAVGIGNSIAASGAQVDFTGHSLGGGLASAASQTSGRPALTINAAGLHPATVARYGGTTRGDGSQITALRIENEPLTGAQEPGYKTHLGIAAVRAIPFAGPALSGVGGAVVATIPKAVGVPFEVPGSGNYFSRHGLEQVKKSIEAAKAKDQAALEKSTGKKCSDK